MREKCKCKRATCGWEWVSRIKGGPKCCPGCKSPTWRTVSSAQEKSKVKMACAICKKGFQEGQAIYRFQEGRNTNGVFVPEGVENQGLYCEKCSPSEDVLPFAE